MDIKEQHEGVRTKSERLKQRRQKARDIKVDKKLFCKYTASKRKTKMDQFAINKKERQPANETGALFSFFPL